MLVKITTHDRSGAGRFIWVESGYDPQGTLTSRLNRLMSKGQYATAVHYVKCFRPECIAHSGTLCAYQSVDEAACDLILARALLYVGQMAKGIALLDALLQRLEGRQRPDDLATRGHPLSPEGARWNHVRGRAHNDLGYAHWMYAGDYGHTLEEFGKALPYFKASHLDEECAHTYDNIGRVRLEQGCYEDALYWMEKGLALRNEILEIVRDWESKTQDEATMRARERAEYRRALSLISLSKACLAVGEFRKAERLSMEALQVCRRMGEKRGSGLAHIPLAAAMRRIALSEDRALEERKRLLFQATEHLVRALGTFEPRALTGMRAGSPHISEPIRLVETHRELGLVYRDRAILAQQSGSDPIRVQEFYERALKHHRAAIDQGGHSNQRLWGMLYAELAETRSLFPQLSGDERPREPAGQAAADRFSVYGGDPVVRFYARSQADSQRYRLPAAAAR